MLPGLRVCAGWQMCLLCFQCDLLLAFTVCPSSIWMGLSLQTPFNQFLFITLMHCLTKHINTLNYLYVHTYTHILSLQSTSCCPGKSTVGARSFLPIWPTGLRKRTRECHLISSLKTREFWQGFTYWVFFFVIQFIFCG